MNNDKPRLIGIAKTIMLLCGGQADVTDGPPIVRKFFDVAYSPLEDINAWCLEHKFDEENRRIVKIVYYMLQIVNNIKREKIYDKDIERINGNMDLLIPLATEVSKMNKTTVRWINRYMPDDINVETCENIAKILNGD